MSRIGRTGPEGFLVVSKPYGWTSHDVVAAIRKLTRVRRVGHGGTLDPTAVGVLVVALGRATRLLDYPENQDKCYCGDVVLGAATNTDDSEGTVLYARDPSRITLDRVVEALAGFIGEIEQVPPQFSAVKLQGKKAYEIARRGGPLELAPRKVTIKGISVVGWEPPIVSLVILCSKGTYIRSIARDLGERLGVGAHLGALVRLANGKFTMDDALDIEDVRLAVEFEYLDKLLLPPDEAVAHLPAVIVSPSHSADMLEGRRWWAREKPGAEMARVYSQDGGFLGLARWEFGFWQPSVVFSEGA